jgi:hypothetical protein
VVSLHSIFSGAVCGQLKKLFALNTHTTFDNITFFRFDYALKVLDITKKAYATKYFISNNGRLAPRLVRKLRDTTKLIYTETKPTAASKRASRRKNVPINPATTVERNEQLADKLNEINIVESADNESVQVDKSVDETFEDEDLKEEDQEEIMSEDNSTDFDDSSDESAQSASESSSSEGNPKEKGARRTTRRRQRMSSD